MLNFALYPPYCKTRVMPSKILTMKHFNAQQAKQIVDSLYTDELHNILVDIKAKSEQGETVLHIYKPIKGKTVEALRDKGFKVTDQPSIAIQKEGLYYSIYWA